MIVGYIQEANRRMEARDRIMEEALERIADGKMCDGCKKDLDAGLIRLYEEGSEYHHDCNIHIARVALEEAGKVVGG